MMQPFDLPSPQTTLVLLEGASRWPHASHEFETLEACQKAAEKMRKYFRESFGIPENNVLWLFNDTRNAIEMDKRICEYIDEVRDPPARDLILYHVGHGKPTRDGKSLYLPIWSTSAHNPEGTSLSFTNLATTLKVKARSLRRFYILDCCFAFLGVNSVQGDLLATLFKATLDEVEISTSGYTGLFSSDKSGSSALSAVLPDQTNTFFTEALLQVLSEGNSYAPDNLSLKVVFDLLNERLTALEKKYHGLYPEMMRPPHPQIYPGTVAEVPLFPNLAEMHEEVEQVVLPEPVINPRSEKERLPRAEEERARLGEEEEAQPPLRLPHPVGIGIIQGVHRRQLSWRKTGLLLILALLILGGAGGLFATVRIPTARMHAATTATAQASATEQILNPTTVGGLVKKWAYRTGGLVQSEPAVVGGVIYIGSDDYNLYALDAATGTKKWAHRIGGKYVGSPMVVGGVVYVSSEEFSSNDGTLYALDAATGTKKWAYQAQAPYVSLEAVVGGVVYVGFGDDTLYALDAATGTKKWAYRAGTYVTSEVVGGVVYIGSEDHNLYALDAATGTKKWAYQARGAVDSWPEVVGGVVYVGSEDHNLYALDAATGTKKWAYRTGGAVDEQAVAGGVVYVSSEDLNLYALDAATGTKQWVYRTGGVINYLLDVVGGVVYGSTSGTSTLWALDAATGTKKWIYQTGVTEVPTLVGGVVYVGSEDHNLYALDAATGTKKWAYQIGGVSEPPVVVGGVVYVGSEDHNLYAFHLPGI